MREIIPYRDAVFFNKHIETLNDALSELRWITSQYPIAWIGKDDKGTYPEVYYNDGENNNVRIMPEGDAISFFQIEGDMTEVDDYFFSVPVSLIVWADLRKVFPLKKYDYTAELIKDVIRVLRDNNCNDLTINTDQALDEFTYLQKSIEQNTMRPYTAFKISFNFITSIC